jgi:hypothetical protein
MRNELAHHQRGGRLDPRWQRPHFAPLTRDHVLPLARAF